MKAPSDALRRLLPMAKMATGKRPGRPATGKDPTVSFRLSREKIDGLDKAAAEAGVRRSQFIRGLVEAALGDKRPNRGKAK